LSEIAVRALEGEDSEQDLLGGLLHALSDEMHLLACEIVALGEFFSGQAAPDLGADHVRALQSFDSLGQQALAHAQLLSGIERFIAGGSPAQSVEDLIGKIPLHASRNRLLAVAAGLAPAADARKDEEGELDWF
jgi:hypothetical protein